MKPDSKLWTAAVGIHYGLDFTTTAVAISYMGATEANPLPAAVMDTVGTIPGMLVLQTALFLFTGALWATARRAELPASWAIPAAVAAVGAVVSAHNLVKIGGQLL